MQIDPQGNYTGAMVLAIIQEIGDQHRDRTAQLEQQRNDAMNAVADAKTDSARLQRLCDNLERRMQQIGGELNALRAKPADEGGQNPALPN